MNRKKIIGFILAVISFSSLFYSTGISDLSIEGRRCLAVFLLVFFLYAFEVFHAALISLAIVPLLVILRIVPIKEALSGFSSTSTYLIAGAFIITGAMIESRLGDRIAYSILLIVGNKTRNISFGIMCVCILLAFIIPSSTSRTAMMIPVCLKIIQLYQGDELNKTKFSANIMMTLCCTNSAIGSGILTATITNPMAVEYIHNATGLSVTYRQWLIWGGPAALICTLLGWVLIQFMFKPERTEINNGEEYVREELKKLGPIGIGEIKVIVILVMAVVLWFAGDLVGLDSCTVCILCACIICLPKIGYISWVKACKYISVNVLFLVSGGISLGAAMSSTGAATWLAERIFDLLGMEGLSSEIILIAILVVVQFMHAFFAGTATMANVFFPIVAGIATISGISPMIMIVMTAFIIGGYPVLMFFNTTPNILCYDTGHLSAENFMKFGTVFSIVVCIVYGLCVEFYWPLVGL
ncbi:MAG: SLC13 family permease [Wujia sp.]